MTPEERRAYLKRWHEAHREQIHARQKRYYKENRNRIREARRKRYWTQKESKQAAE
jgi:hypothetical protein